MSLQRTMGWSRGRSTVYGRAQVYLVQGAAGAPSLQMPFYWLTLAPRSLKQKHNRETRAGRMYGSDLSTATFQSISLNLHVPVCKLGIIAAILKIKLSNPS